MKIELGHKVADLITGFRGTVTGLVQYISGCNQALVVPTVDEKTEQPRESHWFDLDRLVVCTEVPRIVLMVNNPGPDKAAPKR